MLEKFEGPILIERAQFLISHENGSPAERKRWALQAVNYLHDIGYTKSPYWENLLSVSGAQGIEQLKTTTEKELLSVQKAISHEYVGAISILETKPVPSFRYYQNLETVTQLLLLSKNYKGLEELEYQLNGASDALGNLIEEEAEALRRIQLLICSSFYLRRRYFDCCKSFFKLLDDDTKILDTLVREQENEFMTNVELLLIVTISVIVSVPFDNYEDFIHIENLARFRTVCPKLIECLKLLINTRFGRFLTIWHGEFDRQCTQSLFLSQGWTSARYMMRNKIYFFYLRISNKLEISYLSKTLNIDEQIIRQELSQLFVSAHLNFKIAGDLIFYQHEHYLENVLARLKKNHQIIGERLQEKSSANKYLKDLVQEIIISNNGDEDQRNDTIVGSSIKRRTTRYEFDDNMDIDEINDVSDMESASFES